VKERGVNAQQVMQKQSFTLSHKQSDALPVSEQWPLVKANLPVPFFHYPSFTAEREITLYGTSLSPVWVSCHSSIPLQPFAYFPPPCY